MVFCKVKVDFVTEYTIFESVIDRKFSVKPYTWQVIESSKIDRNVRDFRPKFSVIPLKPKYFLRTYIQHFCVTWYNEKYDIECESHFLFSCTSYSDLSHAWFLRLEIPDNFNLLSLEEKLKLVLNHPTNIKPTAKFIIDAFNARNKILF